MTIKIGINGFGRIGRKQLRSACKTSATSKSLASTTCWSLTTWPTCCNTTGVHGRFKGTVSVDGNTLIVNGKKIRLTQERDPANLKWNEVGADVVIESTGLFLDKVTAQKHLDAGAKKVILSAPSKDDTPMFVFGVNSDSYAGQAIISNASCTTNCLAPVAKVLNDKWGIKRGLMTTVHAATATQKTVDGPSNKDWRGGAASWKTSSLQHWCRQGCGRGHSRTEQEAHRHVLPRAHQRRVRGGPDRGTEQGSQLRRYLRRNEGAKRRRPEGRAGLHHRQGGGHRLPRGETCTSVFDADAGIALDGTFVKVVAWYDNERGYSNKCLEMVRVMASNAPARRRCAGRCPRGAVFMGLPFRPGGETRQSWRLAPYSPCLGRCSHLSSPAAGSAVAWHIHRPGNVYLTRPWGVLLPQLPFLPCPRNLTPPRPTHCGSWPPLFFKHLAQVQRPWRW